MFRATLCTMAKTWKQSKSTRTDEWVNKMGYTHTEKYYSAIKRTASCHVQQQEEK